MIPLRDIRRIGIITLWTLLAALVWLLLYLIALPFCAYFGVLPFPTRVPVWVFVAVPLGGTIPVASAALLLGILGRLPGTSKRRRRVRQGFPVEPVVPDPSPPVGVSMRGR